MEYNLIVIGAGAAGLTAAGFMGRVGGRVAIIERDKFGGDCTWVGCVPSKALLKVSKIAHSIRTAGQYGITAGPPEIDMTAVRAYVKQAVEDIGSRETPEIFSKEYDVESIIGEARFIDAHTIEIDGKRRMTAEKFIIATGARPTMPPVEGIDSVPYHTNETIFDNDRLPDHLLIMGAGPIGVEMAQAHARLGAKVTMMDSALLRQDEPEASDLMCKILEREGVTFVPSLVQSVQSEADTITATLQNGAVVQGDMLLVAVGRTPNVDLGLEQAGVHYTQKGITVDNHLRTNVPHIYAVGDCTPAPKFTHYAGFQGGIAGRNATLPVVNSSGHDDVIPWVTYTDPEVAHVGQTEAEARRQHGSAVRVHHFSTAHGDRTVAENDVEGFIKLVYKGSDRLLGATIVSDRAGEMIFELLLVLKGKLSLTDITTMIHPYPTYNDVVKRAVADLVIQGLFEGMTGRAIDLFRRVRF
jgi:pyruvate/2-oxoglutarate dehydrogenase complex dihydrolipoamide dehydrogenase (E3) component